MNIEFVAAIIVTMAAIIVVLTLMARSRNLALEESRVVIKAQMERIDELNLALENTNELLDNITELLKRQERQIKDAVKNTDDAIAMNQVLIKRLQTHI